MSELVALALVLASPVVVVVIADESPLSPTLELSAVESPRLPALELELEFEPELELELELMLNEELAALELELVNAGGSALHPQRPKANAGRTTTIEKSRGERSDRMTREPIAKRAVTHVQNSRNKRRFKEIATACSFSHNTFALWLGGEARPASGHRRSIFFPTVTGRGK